MKITKTKIRKVVYNTLGKYGLARPPLADDLAGAVFDMLKAIEQSVQSDGAVCACEIPITGGDDVRPICKRCGQPRR